MNIRKLFPLFLALVLLLSLAGCGAESAAGNAAMDMGKDPLYREDFADSDNLSKEEVSTQTNLPENRKLIQRVRLEAETEKLEDLLTHVNERTAELGGYIESQDIYNGSTYNGKARRNATLTIRIPAKNLDSFVDQISENSNIVSSNKTMDDITLSYVATESRIKALETEEARLLELLAMANNLEELLIIESKLTDVRTELEQVKSTLRLYDNQVDYGTVTLTITEVVEYTEVEEEPVSIWDRIGSGFTKSLENVWEGLQSFFVAFVVCIPYLLVLGVLAVVTIVIIRLCTRKKRKKKQE